MKIMGYKMNATQPWPLKHALCSARASHSAQLQKQECLWPENRHLATATSDTSSASVCKKRCRLHVSLFDNKKRFNTFNRQCETYDEIEWMGLVRITSWYPNLNGSHFGLPPARSTEWLDCHPKSCEVWRIRTGPIQNEIGLKGTHFLLLKIFLHNLGLES